MRSHNPIEQHIGIPNLNQRRISVYKDYGDHLATRLFVFFVDNSATIISKHGSSAPTDNEHS